MPRSAAQAARVGIYRGVPCVDGLESDSIVVDGRPYMDRHYLRRGYDFAVQFHHLLTDDPPARAMHDHPADFVSTLLTGGYREYAADGTVVEYEAPCVIRRPAELVHRLELLDGPMWTLVSWGPVRRVWGFHTDVGFVPWRRYLAGGDL